jgi:hypothetical protein
LTTIGASKTAGVVLDPASYANPVVTEAGVTVSNDGGNVAAGAEVTSGITNDGPFVLLDGVTPTGINASGEITGSAHGAAPGDNTGPGFIYSDGSITTFAVPGSTTWGTAVNAAGEVTGYYQVGSGYQGFIYNAGTIATFEPPDPPGAADMFPSGINASGQIVGSAAVFVPPFYMGSDDEGFINNAGTITFFTVPGASDIGTFPNGVNDAGLIVGSFTPASGPTDVDEGFLDTAGVFTTIDVAGSVSTGPEAINASGEITGTWTDSDGANHGFIDMAGTITTFDVPGAVITEPLAINDDGVITGFYSLTNPAEEQHGFIYNGRTISTFDVPGAFATVPVGINDSGEITGAYIIGTAGQPDTFDKGGFLYTIACYLAGTMILTDSGERPVEQLTIGDRVVTLSGEATPIKWLGHRRADCRRHPRPSEVWPVRVRAGAFTNGLPRHDLWLSPDHAVYFDDVLIPIKLLINGTAITQVPVDEVTYYHVELPHHGLLLAEGLACESYLDTGNRWNFAEGDNTVALRPDFSSLRWEADACALLIVTGPKLEAAKLRVNTHPPGAIPQRGAEGTRAA